MYGYAPRRFGFNWIIIAIALIIGVAGFSGHNSITGEWDWSRGFDNVAAIFGGGMSFIAVLGLVLAGGLVVISVKMAGEANKNTLAGLLALGYVVLVLIIGNRWVQMPSAAIWILVAFIALVTIAAALVTSRTRVIATP